MGQDSLAKFKFRDFARLKLAIEFFDWGLGHKQVFEE